MQGQQILSYPDGYFVKWLQCIESFLGSTWAAGPFLVVFHAGLHWSLYFPCHKYAIPNLPDTKSSRYVSYWQGIVGHVWRHSSKLGSLFVISLNAEKTETTRGPAILGLVQNSDPAVWILSLTESGLAYLPWNLIIVVLQGPSSSLESVLLGVCSCF